MSTSWQIAIVFLFVVNTLLAIVVLGVLRRAITALERTRGSDPDANGVADHGGSHEHGQNHDLGYQGLGAPLPGVSQVTWPAGAFMLVLLEEDCSACRTLAADIYRTRRDLEASGSRFFFVLDGRQGSFGRVAKYFNAHVDENRRVAASLNVSESPLALLIDDHHTVVASSHPNTARELLATPDLDPQSMVHESVDAARSANHEGK